MYVNSYLDDEVTPKIYRLVNCFLKLKKNSILRTPVSLISQPIVMPVKILNIKHMEQIIQEIKSLEERIFNLRSQLHEYNDGFLYLTRLRCYGSLTYVTYTNKFFVQELCDEYQGDEGIVDVYTTNPDPNIQNYGDVIVMTLEEIQNISQENISMSRAIANWIART
jgi:hypothetical protein